MVNVDIKDTLIGDVLFCYDDARNCLYTIVLVLSYTSTSTYKDRTGFIGLTLNVENNNYCFNEVGKNYFYAAHSFYFKRC